MFNLDPLSQQWNDLVEQLGQVGPMHAGSICQQTNRSKAKDGTELVRGPYTILTCKRKGRTVTRHLSSPEQIEQSRQQIENFRRFKDLVSQLVELGQQRALAEPADDGKKNSPKRSRRSSRPKRRG